jgi:prolyl oligopeptidase
MEVVMRLCSLYPAAAIGLVAVMVPPADAQRNDSLRNLAQRYWDATMERNPTWATAIGDHRFNDRLEDAGEAGREEWTATLKALLDEVRRIPAGALSAEDRLTRDLLERDIKDKRRRIECGLHLVPLDPLDGPHIRFPLILVSHPFRNAADFRDYVARLRAFPRQAEQVIDNMRAGVQRRFVSPRVTIKKVIPQLQTHIVGDVTRSEFYAPVEKAGKLGDQEKRAVTAEIADAISTAVVPAYRRLLAYVEGDYLPACRSTVGIGSVPGGDKIYETLVYLNTTVRLSPDEIHELGLTEVARIRGEMAKIKEQVAFDGTLDEFLTHMRTDARYRFTSADELYAAADKILQRTKPLMKRLFNRLPKADCVMKPIEAFRAASSPVAFYNSPPEDGSRPGYFYINTYAPKERLRFTLEALTYHESIPGHHFQMALDQENAALPKFRRYAGFTAYVEGWALYTEKLGYEIGGYGEPYSRFGQLTFEMWRACRLVVDTGMHFQDWSRQRAIDYLAANTSLALLNIEAEVDRYISWPGQALAYKVGELKILQLRKEAQRAHGDRFDLRAFHDALLSGGAMPIDMLEKRMRDWTARRIE